MKLSYRDKMIAIIALVLVILIAGFFALIRPMINTIKESEAAQKKTEKEWTDIEKEINRIPDVQDRITEKHAESVALAQYFTEERNSIQVDKFIQEYFDKNNMELTEGLAVSNTDTASLDFYYYTPSINTYAIQEYADLDGSLAAANAEILAESMILSARTAQTVAHNSVSVSVKTTQEDLKNFLNEIKALDTSIIVSDLVITDWDWNAEAEEGEELAPEDLNHSVVTLTLEFYSVQVPTEPALGK